MVFAVLGLAMVAIPFAVTGSTPPVLTLTPASGPAGTAVDWEGSGFTASGSIAVTVVFSGPVPNPPTSGACLVSTTNPDEMDCHYAASATGTVGPNAGSGYAMLTARTSVSFSIVALDITSGVDSNTVSFTVSGTTTTTTSSSSSTGTGQTVTWTVTMTTTQGGQTITRTTTQTFTLTTSTSGSGKGLSDLQWGGVGFTALGLVLVASDARLGKKKG